MSPLQNQLIAALDKALEAYVIRNFGVLMAAPASDHRAIDRFYTGMYQAVDNYKKALNEIENSEFIEGV